MKYVPIKCVYTANLFPHTFMFYFPVLNSFLKYIYTIWGGCFWVYKFSIVFLAVSCSLADVCPWLQFLSALFFVSFSLQSDLFCPAVWPQLPFLLRLFALVVFLIAFPIPTALLCVKHSTSSCSQFPCYVMPNIQRAAVLTFPLARRPRLRLHCTFLVRGKRSLFQAKWIAAC